MAGPLDKLDQNRFGDEQYRYPIDIGTNPKHGHIVQFSIYDPESIKFEGAPQGDGGGDAGNNTSIVDVLGNISSLADNALTNLGNKLDGFLKSGYTAKAGYTQTNGSITLYMPDSLAFNSSASYNTASLGDLIASVGETVLSKIPRMSKLTGALGQLAKGGGPATQIGLDAAGFAINPQQQLIFQGIDFRSFGMAFVFTPKSSSESAMIKSIIQAFKKASAPVLVENTAGFLYRPPALFEITFLSEGTVNPYLHKLGKSVLTDVQVNYAPNGWSAYENGAPVQVTLGLEFQEVELMHRAKIDEGY